MNEGAAAQPLGRLHTDDPDDPLYVVRSPGGVVLCSSCRRISNCRLGVHTETLRTDGVVISEVQCPRDHEGGRNVAHGGWTAGVLDEIVGHVLLWQGQLAVTGTLQVKFVKPVPVERPLIARAHVVRSEGRRVFVEAELKLAHPDVLVASAEAIMVRRPADHFDRHDEWLRSLDAPGGDQ
ncbi:PaaI family thioesterase [Mycobacterium deserti]|uniref:Acyl-coenzyme A thioesterase THEM4 n=1 Tax=Mycobacterium deserti TaxID=2978347 RepID=A0ABT2M4I8_9MYCO|nr:PaaI family thioesterase [Mycobacterium deserti]MCT7657179.1 PaaI family thioesterase [Mycobacterium deserti]